MAHSVLKDKQKAKLEEEKASTKIKMSNPQMTKKKAQWLKNTQRANNAGNTSNQYGNYQRRGLREASYEIKPEWPQVIDFSKQRHDKLPEMTPSDKGVKIEAGRLH